MGKRKAVSEEGPVRKSRRTRHMSPELKTGIESNIVRLASRAGAGTGADTADDTPAESTQRETSSTWAQEEASGTDATPTVTDSAERNAGPTASGATPADTVHLDDSNGRGVATKPTQASNAPFETTADGDTTPDESASRKIESKTTQTTPQDLPDQVFSGENAVDYPNSEPRVIRVEDANRPAMAILLNVRLSKILQAAARAEREWREEKHRSEEQLQVIANFQSWLSDQADRLWELAREHEKLPGNERIVEGLQRKSDLLTTKSLQPSDQEPIIRERLEDV